MSQLTPSFLPSVPAFSVLPGWRHQGAPQRYRGRYEDEEMNRVPFSVSPRMNLELVQNFEVDESVCGVQLGNLSYLHASKEQVAGMIIFSVGGKAGQGF